MIFDQNHDSRRSWVRLAAAWRLPHSPAETLRFYAREFQSFRGALLGQAPSITVL